MLDVIDLNFDYQDQPLLNNISFHLAPGGLLHLRGANGVGKTTLLKLIAGLYLPLQGEIQFLGRTINQDRSAYQRQLCFVGHKTGVNPQLTLREHCFFDLHYSSSSFQAIQPRQGRALDQHPLIRSSGTFSPCLDRRENRGDSFEDLEKLACLFKLEHHLDAPCGLLSAGQRRQAGLLRLWLTDAKLWLLDEPLVALDDRAIQLIIRHIEVHRERGGAVLLTSHQPLPLNRSDYEEYCL